MTVSALTATVAVVVAGRGANDITTTTWRGALTAQHLRQPQLTPQESAPLLDKGAENLILELGEACRDVASTVHHRDARWTILGPGRRQAGAPLDMLPHVEAMVRARLDILSPQICFRDATECYAGLTRCQRRGVRWWIGAPAPVLAASPLVSLQWRAVVAAPVVIPTMLVDRSLAVIQVQHAPWEAPVSVATTLPTVVRLVGRLVDAALQDSLPAHLAGSPVGPRQLAVARLLLTGLTNAAISRRLAVSVRTVGADLGLLTDLHGVHGREALCAALGGRVDRACDPALLAV